MKSLAARVAQAVFRHLFCPVIRPADAVAEDDGSSEAVGEIASA